VPVPTTGGVIRRRLQKDAVYERLLAAVLDGTFEPGQRLRDHELEEMFAVSRTPVRTALARLERLRVVTSSTSRVVRVAEADPTQVPELTEVLSAMLLVGWRRLARGEVRDAQGAPLRPTGLSPTEMRHCDEPGRALAGLSLLVDALVTPEGGLLATTTDSAWVPLRHQLRLARGSVRADGVERCVDEVDRALVERDAPRGVRALLDLSVAPLLRPRAAA